jgi:5'-nucleotidase
MRNYRRIPLCLIVFLFLFGFISTQDRASEGITILLSNDDGYDAPGIKALVEALRPLGEIIVAAPAVEQSGVGHGLTLRAPIMVNERKQPRGPSWYAIEGPPATCVRVALEVLLPRRPDVVISGINRGDNLGTTVYHSGTLGAAREAALVGVPAIAVSIRGEDEKDYAAAAAFTRQLVELLRTKQLLKQGLFLNLNVPAGERKGIRLTRLSMIPRPETFERRVSPRDRLYFWPVWEQLKDDAEGTDVWAFVRGYITVTPMVLDVTAMPEMKSLRELESLSLPASGLR